MTWKDIRDRKEDSIRESTANPSAQGTIPARRRPWASWFYQGPSPRAALP